MAFDHKSHQKSDPTFDIKSNSAKDESNNETNSSNRSVSQENNEECPFDGQCQKCQGLHTVIAKQDSEISSLKAALSKTEVDITSTEVQSPSEQVPKIDEGARVQSMLPVGMESQLGNMEKDLDQTADENSEIHDPAPQFTATPSPNEANIPDQFIPSTPEKMDTDAAFKIASEMIQKRRSSCHSELSRSGQVMSITHGFSGASLSSLQIATHLGPVAADKSVNQDCVMGWIPKGGPGFGRPNKRFAIAIADGVSSSWCSELGAQLVTSIALQSLAEQFDSRFTFEKITAIFNRCQSNLTEVFDASFDKTTEFPPESFPAMTWKRKFVMPGRMLQTTLTLCWCDGTTLYFCSLGDAGLSLEWSTPQNVTHRECPVECDDEHMVDALGPRRSNITSQSMNFYDTRLWNCRTFGLQRILQRVAIYTDGVGRGIGNDPDYLFDAKRSSNNHNKNDAESFLEFVVENFPSNYADNLTLSFVQLDPIQRQATHPI